ncbi:MAG TPA: hypothetical protein VK902_01225 [Rubrobacter sp.]|nr:hypothetical protein [Rubrobacter sp.]
MASTDPREGESRAVRSHGNQSVNDSTLTLGLVAAPDIPEKIANELATELPELLSKRVDDRVSWDVSVVVDPLTGTDRKAPEILDVCRERMLKEGWDLAICLTDLPVYRDGQLVVADASAARGVSLVSVPTLGLARLRKRVREATVQLVYELYARIPELGKDASLENGQKGNGDATVGDSPGPRPQRLIERRLADLVAPFQRVEPPDEDMKEMDVDARFAAPKVPGHLRLWAGMVLANRPWKILPSFKTSIAAAFGMAAWVLASSAIWMLADSLGLVRLLLLMVLSVTAIVVWIIVAHGLWEHPDEEEAPHWAALYNGVTVLTMTTAVLMAYAVLFVLVFVAASVFVPSDYLQSTLGHPVGPGEYLILAWLAASLATIVGALGSTLEDEETVRNAVYGYRQRRRQEAEDANNSEEDSPAT